MKNIVENVPRNKMRYCSTLGQELQIFSENKEKTQDVG